MNGTARPLRSRQLRALHESLMTCREIITYRLRRALIPGDGDCRDSQHVSYPPSSFPPRVLAAISPETALNLLCQFVPALLPGQIPGLLCRAQR